MNRRELLASAAALVAGGSVAPAFAQDSYPTKSIRLIAASAPGTLVDQAARLYADRLAADLKQSVVVDNIAGGSTSVAARQLIRSTPDGYTLMVAANTMVVAPLIVKNAPYGTRNFAAIGELARAPGILVVSAKSPFKSLHDLVAAAKARPGALSYASSGIGSTNHLPVEMLAREAGVSFTHVPYKGISLAVPDVLGERVTFMMGTSTSTAAMMANGSLRALAISSENRAAAYPTVPTFCELGYPDATSSVWIGMVAPAGLPPAVVSRLTQALEAARRDPNVLKSLEAAGQAVSDVRTPAQFASVMRQEEERVRRIVSEKQIVTE